MPIYELTHKGILYELGCHIAAYLRGLGELPYLILYTSLATGQSWCRRRFDKGETAGAEYIGCSKRNEYVLRVNHDRVLKELGSVGEMIEMKGHRILC
jgi:hypothetical protein